MLQRCGLGVSGVLTLAIGHPYGGCQRPGAKYDWATCLSAMACVSAVSAGDG